MTDHDIARPDPFDARDDQQAGLLDRYLDDLRHGGDPPADLDPALMRMARLTSALARIPPGSGTTDIHRATKAQTWEALMRPATIPPVTSSVVAFPIRPGSIEPTTSWRARPPGSILRPAPFPSPSRLRRWRGQSLGLVAMLTLVALVTLSGLAVFLTAPPSTTSPTAMLAGVGDGTPDGGLSGGVLLPNLTTCDVEPRDYAGTLQLIEPYLSGRFEPLPVLIDGRDWPMYVDDVRVPDAEALPNGTPPDPVVVDQISTLWATYQGCQRSNEYLRSASLFSDAGMVRYHISGTNYFLAQSYRPDTGIGLLAQEPAAEEDLPVLDVPSSRGITELRLIGDDRAAALISTNWRDADTPPRANDPRQRLGHIVFVREGDRWLIDELLWWGGSAGGVPQG